MARFSFFVRRPLVAISIALLVMMGWGDDDDLTMAEAASTSSSSTVRCFSGITTLSGTLGDTNSPNNPCPGGYCAADWQLAYDTVSGAVQRFQLLIGPHQIDLASLHGGASVQQIECSTRASDSVQGQDEIVFVARSGYQSGAATFEWRYRASATVNCDQVRSHDVVDGFLGMTLNVVVLNVGSWASANADVQPEFALSAFETDCAAIMFDAPTLDHYCYRLADVALSPRGNDPYVGTFCAPSDPCSATVTFCLDTASFTQVSRISVALNDRYCVTSGEEHSASATQCVGSSVALIASTVDSPGVSLTFGPAPMSSSVDICVANLETSTATLGVEILVDGETRYHGSVDLIAQQTSSSSSSSLSSHRIGFPPLTNDSPCDESRFWMVHADAGHVGSASSHDAHTCIRYCLNGLVSDASSCSINAVVYSPCNLVYHIDVTMCSNGAHTVHWYNISNAADGAQLVALDSTTAFAMCDYYFINTFSIGNVDTTAGQPNRIHWSIVGAPFNCSADMWQQMATWTGDLGGMFIYSPAVQTILFMVSNDNNSLSESLCADPQTVPSASVAPSQDATASSTPSTSAQPSTSPVPSASAQPSLSVSSSASTVPSASSAPSTTPAPTAPCALRCLRSGYGYWKNSRKTSLLWTTLPEPRSLCGFDYAVLVDPANKQVKQAIQSELLREALRLVAVLDLNLHANLVNDSECSVENAIDGLPLDVQTAHAGIHTRYANATLCQPQTYSSVDSEATILEQWVASLKAFLNTSGGANPTGLQDCGTLDASSLSESWEDAKHERAVEPVHVCTTKLSGFNDTCLSVFAYRNPNDECVFIGTGEHNRLIPDGVVRSTIGCWAPTQYFESNTGPEDFSGNGTFAVLWFCKQYKSRHLAWRLGTHISNSQSPAPQDGGWVHRRADAYWLVDTCKRSTIDYWLNFYCY